MSESTTFATAIEEETFFEEISDESQRKSRPIPNLSTSGITPDLVRQRFFDAMYYVRDHIDEYVVHPGVDFTRNSRFDVVTLMKFITVIGAGSSINELNKFFSLDEDAPPPYNSTFCEARKKLLPAALEAVFRRFTDSFTELREFKGYRLVGVDGSTINIPLNMKEKETLHQNKEDQKYFSQCYFNGAYDLLNAIYVDVIITTLQKTDERSALLEMAKHQALPSNVILVGDRGYGGWKVFATLIDLNRKFVIREKDKDSQGIFKSLNLSAEEEFDIVKTIVLTNKQTKETLNHPELYKIIMTNQDFPYLDKENHYYAIKLRFIRKKVAPGKYICVITNLLNPDEFTADDIQYVYFLRWGQEGSYRVYKWTIGTLQFHARKYSYVRQELYAKMVEFNICQLIAGCVPMEDDSDNSRVLTEEEYLETCRTIQEQTDREKADTPDTDVAASRLGKAIRYKPNISAAITNIKQYLLGKGNQEKLIMRIKRYLIPIRPGRSFARNIKSQSATTLLYRAA